MKFIFIAVATDNDGYYYPVAALTSGQRYKGDWVPLFTWSDWESNPNINWDEILTECFSYTLSAKEVKSEELDEINKVCVVCVKDEDGYYNPIFAVTHEALAIPILQTWIEHQKDNEHWRPEHWFKEWVYLLKEKQAHQEFI